MLKSLINLDSKSIVPAELRQKYRSSPYSFILSLQNELVDFGQVENLMQTQIVIS